MKEKELRSPVKFASKGWGFAKQITNSDKFNGEFWYVIKDAKCPLHYHKLVNKTLYIHSGRVKIFYSQNLQTLKQTIAKMGPLGVYSHMENVTVHKGDNFHVPPGCAIQLIASEDSEVYVFSSALVSGDYFELAKGD